MAFLFGTPTSDLQSHLKKIDPNVKAVEKSGKDYKVTYNNGVTRTLSSAGVKDLESKFAIPTGRSSGDDNLPEYFYDYRFVTPQDIARADVSYVAPQAGFNPATYDVGSGVGLRKLQELLDLGASRQQIVDIFKTAPVIGDRMQQLFPELRDLDPYTPVSGLSPEQLASYDVSTGIGMTKLEDLLNLGATPEQIVEIAGRAPVVGTRLQTLFPQFVPPPPEPTRFSPSVPSFNYSVPSFNYNAPPAGLAAIAPPTPVSLVQAAEAPVLAPSVQTVAGMKEGGLAAAARQVAKAGRGGDTMLAHINREEAGLLKALGGSGTINPKTGLPEFFLDDIFGRGKLIDINIGKKSQQALAVAAGIAAGAGYIPSFIPGLSPVASTALLTAGASALGNQNLSQGIQAGLTAYGAGSITQAVAPQAAAGGSGAAGGGAGSMVGGSAGVEAGTVPVGGEYVPADAVEAAYGPLTPPPTVPPGRELITTPEQFTAASQAAEATRAGFPLSDPDVVGESLADLSSPDVIQAVSPQNAAATAPDGFLARNLPAGAQKYIADPILNASGTTLAAGTLLGTSLLGGAQERQAFARQQAALRAQEEEKKRRYQELFASTLGQVPIRTARQGGLMSLAKGGMTYMEAGGTTGLTGMPRDVKGTGDGMSDSVPATIEGVQEARLADGEFVIPADVVADIGNGSSNAGSKKLYDMMDRIRKARHGTTEQPPEIDAEALMPA